MADPQFLIGTVTIGSILVFLLALAAVIFVSYLCYKGTKTVLLLYTSRSVARWSARIAGYIVFVLGLYIIDLTILGFDINATIASLGIISIALAFASQQIISNLLAGILMAINRTVRLDDWVELGGDPTTGIAQVKDLTFTRTILKDRDGRVFLVPNANLLSSKIVNYSKSGFIEVPLNITIPFDIPFNDAQETILAVLKDHEGVLGNGTITEAPGTAGMRSSFFFQGYTGQKKADPEKHNPRVLFTGIVPQGNTISIRFWVRDIVRREEITSAILAGISCRLSISGKR
ncbi:MAG: mechanosensitive ion channel [Methanoregula sp.]|nr:MAG: mechanosensitive ion channel [Methanoregula sp.]